MQKLHLAARNHMVLFAVKGLGCALGASFAVAMLSLTGGGVDWSTMSGQWQVKLAGCMRLTEYVVSALCIVVAADYCNGCEHCQCFKRYVVSAVSPIPKAMKRCLPSLLAGGTSDCGGMESAGQCHHEPGSLHWHESGGCTSFKVDALQNSGCQLTLKQLTM